MSEIPWVLFLFFAVFFFGPPPLYFLVIFPNAETTRDPDAIEALAFFGGTLVMLIGIVFGLITVGVWLHRRNALKHAVSVLSVED